MAKSDIVDILDALPDFSIDALAAVGYVPADIASMTLFLLPTDEKEELQHIGLMSKRGRLTWRGREAAKIAYHLRKPTL